LLDARAGEVVYPASLQRDPVTARIDRSVLLLSVSVQVPKSSV
jgi:hypothetical protein